MNGHLIGAEVAHQLCKLFVLAVFVFADDAGHLEQIHLLHQQHIQLSVGGIGLRHGIEAAAVKSAVADADHSLFFVNGLAVYLYRRALIHCAEMQ